MKHRVRQAEAGDLPLLRQLEADCFDGPRRARPAALRRSVAGGGSGLQVVRVIEEGVGAGRRLVGSSILWRYPRSWRVYSIAVHPDRQGRGLGILLMRDAEALAAAGGAERIILEADAANPRLIAWYRRHGFAVRKMLPDYYAPGRAVASMVKDLPAGAGGAPVGGESESLLRQRANR